MSIIKNKDALLIYRRQAEQYLAKLKDGDFSDAVGLHQVLYPYILCKYSLWGDCEGVYDLNELAELSVAKTIRLTKRTHLRLTVPLPVRGQLPR